MQRWLWRAPTSTTLVFAEPMSPPRRAAVTVMELESQVAMAMAAPEQAVAPAAHVALRGVAAAASLAAAVLVVTNRQERWGIKVDFTMFQVWVAFVATNFLCAAYSAATAIMAKTLISKCWLFADLNPEINPWINLTVVGAGADEDDRLLLLVGVQVMVNLAAAAAAAAGAIGSVVMWGNKPSGWYPVCRMYRRYCNAGLAALVLSLAAVLALAAAAALSRYPRTPARRGGGSSS